MALVSLSDTRPTLLRCLYGISYDRFLENQSLHGKQLPDKKLCGLGQLYQTLHWFGDIRTILGGFCQYLVLFLHPSSFSKLPGNYFCCHSHQWDHERQASLPDNHIHSYNLCSPGHRLPLEAHTQPSMVRRFLCCIGITLSQAPLVGGYKHSP